MHYSSVFICLSAPEFGLKVLIYDFVKHFRRELNYSKSFVPLLIDPNTFIAKGKNSKRFFFFKSVPYVTTGSS